MPETISPAETASTKALSAMFTCLDARQSFRLEAGAGAGKTYSLIKALHFLIEQNSRKFLRRGKKIACITYTNAAKNEIQARIDRSPVVFCETNHAFCWSLISGFQKQLRELIKSTPAWQERLEEAGSVEGCAVEYVLGHRSIRDGRISLGHDDILPLTITLMSNAKFRRLLVSRFPIILIDEYQDTDGDWIEAIKSYFLGQPGSPLFGFFGDHWQKIYGNGCGKLEHWAVTEIGKEANFRSVATIVDCLNRMRPGLPQFVSDPTSVGEVRVFHTNPWIGVRRNRAPWVGDLPAEVAHVALEQVKTLLVTYGWDLTADKTKILMLTHRVLAAEQGYSSMPVVFRYNDSFAKKENPHIAYLVDHIEPACEAFVQHKFGEMFNALGGDVPVLNSHADKETWTSAMETLVRLRDESTVGDVIEHLRVTRRPRLPDAVEDVDRELNSFDTSAGTEMPRNLSELQKLREVPYAEVKALRKYLDGHSPFETKHGVKGREFDNVLVVIGRGWDNYNFGKMLEAAQSGMVSQEQEEAFERNRNLFYVACSRPRQRLALLFTQTLSDPALATLQHWFGINSIAPFSPG